MLLKNANRSMILRWKMNNIRNEGRGVENRDKVYSMKIMNESIKCYLFDINELKGEEMYQYALKMLPIIGVWQERKKHIYSFLRLEDKLRCIGAGLMLKYIFDKYHVEYSRLIKNQYGKLYIDNFDILKFNISHSGDYVVCTYGSSESGVDIEKNINGMDIAKRFFTKQEYQIISTGKSNMFTRIWTLKEAYVKERGMGLTIPLDSFEVQPGRIYEREKDDFTALSMIDKTIVANDLEKQFREFQFGDYYISICSRKNITKKIKQVSVGQLCDKRLL